MHMLVNIHNLIGSEWDLISGFIHRHGSAYPLCVQPHVGVRTKRFEIL